MPGAKRGLVDYISRNSFTKAKKFSACDKYFVVETISKVRNSFKQLIRNKMHTVQKFNRILKLHLPSYPANRLIAPQIPTIIQKNSQIRIKPVAIQSSHSNTLLPVASQLTPKNEIINPHLKMSIAL